MTVEALGNLGGVRWVWVGYVLYFCTIAWGCSEEAGKAGSIHMPSQPQVAGPKAHSMNGLSAFYQTDVLNA